MVDSPASSACSRGVGSLSRRSLMAFGVAGLVASACSVDQPGADDEAPTPPAELAPDVAVATAALAEIRILLTAATGTATRFPATRARLSSLVAMHRAHEKSLADAVPDRADAGASVAPSPYVVPRQREVALRTLRTREQRLHDSLDGLALRAQSGDFARLLASMGAAVSQQLAVWSP